MHTHKHTHTHIPAVAFVAIFASSLFGGHLHANVCAYVCVCMFVCGSSDVSLIVCILQPIHHTHPSSRLSQEPLLNEVTQTQSHSQVRKHALTRNDTNTHTNTHTHTHAQTHTHTHSHTYTLTHTHTPCMAAWAQGLSDKEKWVVG
jgi:hypothetical protein